MALTPRCYLSANTGATANTSLTISYSGWTNAGLGASGTAPAAGDFVALVICDNNSGVTASQSGGSDTFTLSNDANLSLFGSTLGYAVAGGGTTGPSFTFSGNTRNAYYIIALAPDSGDTASLDAEATTLTGTTGGTSFQPGSATAAGSGEVSLILNTAKSTSNSAGNSISVTPPSGWTGLPVTSYAGTGSNAAYAAQISYQDGAGPGSVAPGTETMSAAATTSVRANVYHILIQERAPSVPVPLLQSPAYAVQRSVTW